MKRLINWFKALFNRTMDKVEDPEMMLDQARRDMESAVIQNKERAIQAITQRNELEKMLANQKAKSANLDKQAELALKQGNRELALQIVREKQNSDATIQQLQQTYDQACQAVEAVKTAVERQQAETRAKTAETLALKAQWKQAQIQNSIAKTMDGLSFDAQFNTGSYAAASERISRAQSEASARNEMQSQSLQGRLMAMQDSSMDAAAEDELQQMEARLGMRPTTVSADAPPETVQVSEGGQAAAPATPAPASAAETELQQIENRLKNN